jgi:multidrug resistance efflux pump
MKILITTFLISLLLVSCGKKTEETKPIRKDVTETVFASGILEAKNTYSLTSQTDGYLTVVNFEEGDIVQQGNVLAIVDNKENVFNQESANSLYQISERNIKNDAPALLQIKNNVFLAQQKMEQSFLQYQRNQKLLAEGFISKTNLENIELDYKNAKTNFENAKELYKIQEQQAKQQLISNKAAAKVNDFSRHKNQIFAVVSGKVYKKYKQVGDYIKRGETIALIGDATNIYAKVNVDESNISKIKLGQEASIQLNTDTNVVYYGKVSEIYPSFDDETQSFICKITFNATPLNLIVKTQLQSNIVVSNNKKALLIPRNYIDFDNHVIVKGKGKVKVSTKFISNKWVQVLSGIDENTILITDDIKDDSENTSELGSQINI